MNIQAGIGLIKGAEFLTAYRRSRLALEGGLDKFAFLKDEAAIDAELERKVPPMVATGGCVLALEHRIPNGVTIDLHRYYVRRLKEIIARQEQTAKVA